MAFSTQDDATRRRLKRLVVVISDECGIWSQVRALEKKAGVSIAQLQISTRANGKKAKKTKKPKEPGIPSGRHHLLGISEETLRQWRRGEIATGTGSRATSAIQYLVNGLQAFRDRLTKKSDGQTNDGAVGEWSDVLRPDMRRELLDSVESVLSKLQSFYEQYDSEDQTASVYESGRTLGMSVGATQKAIDIACYSVTPLLVKPYYSDLEIAKDALGSVVGLYYVWLRREFNGMVLWLKCTMHVRYLVKMGEQLVIRTKLNLPRIGELRRGDGEDLVDRIKRNHLEYDGFADPKAHRVFWSCERRANSQQDYVHLITGHRVTQTVPIDGKPSYHYVGFVGQYLTAHQDARQSISTGIALMEMVPEQELERMANEPFGTGGLRELIRNAPEIGIMWKEPSILDDPKNERFQINEALATAFRDGRW